jgi:two-component system nitrogen regulation response regulator GlnG
MNGVEKGLFMDSKTVLVVDDDIDVLECVHEILTRHGYESIPCTNALSALSLLESDAAFDLAIIDLMMPDMAGLEFHARIKKMKPELPCIVMTGHSSVESYLRAINNGVFEYLIKPFRVGELKSIVAAALSEPATGGDNRSHQSM